MVRSFRPDPVAPELLDRILDRARRAPSAGNSQGCAFLVLSGPAEVGRYWEVTLPEARRATFPWPGLLVAPVLVLPYVSAEVYVARYAEADKMRRVAAAASARAALGRSAEEWPVPYWFVDGGMVAMGVLLGAVDAGLGACFFGVFEHEAAVAAAFGVPSSQRPIGAIALGWPAEEQRASASAGRPRPPLDSVVHRGRWTGSGGAVGGGSVSTDES